MPDFQVHEEFSQGGAEEHKKKGNEAFKAGKWDDAIKEYNKAIQIDPNQASFYSNRAACWSSKGNHESALADSKKCLERDPSFIKGYSRQGKALCDMGRFDEAEAAFQEGLGVEAGNESLKNGLADVKTAKAQAQRRSSAGTAGARRGGGGMGGMASQFVEKMKSGGMGSRVQMYAIVMGGYMLYNNFIKPAPTRGEGDSIGHEADADDAAPSARSSRAPGAPPGSLRRSFSDVGGSSWLSYMEAGEKSADTHLLMLHRTSWSAEAEYGAALTGLLAKVNEAPPAGGLRLLAPDRPCHGFSPCPPSGGEPAVATAWLKALLGRRAPKRLALVATGRGAAQQALALMREHKGASHLVLVDPKGAAPARASAAKAAPTAQAAADAVRWALSPQSEDEDEEGLKLDASGLPDSCEVTVMYGRDGDEDIALREEIEGQGVPIATRKAASPQVSTEDIVGEVWRATNSVVESPGNIEGASGAEDL